MGKNLSKMKGIKIIKKLDFFVAKFPPLPTPHIVKHFISFCGK
jgi:hypothetical protein